MVATPSAVFANVGHNEHSETVRAELRKDFSNQASEGFVVYSAPTQIMTMGSHASGDTGLKIWIRGSSAVFTTSLVPHNTPIGMAISEATKNPANTVFNDVRIWSMYEGL